MKVICPTCSKKSEMRSKAVDGKLSFHCTLCGHDFSRLVPMTARPEKAPPAPQPVEQREDRSETSTRVEVKERNGQKWCNSGPMSIPHIEGLISSGKWYMP